MRVRKKPKNSRGRKVRHAAGYAATPKWGRSPHAENVPAPQCACRAEWRSTTASTERAGTVRLGVKTNAKRACARRAVVPAFKPQTTPARLGSDAVRHNSVGMRRKCCHSANANHRFDSHACPTRAAKPRVRRAASRIREGEYRQRRLPAHVG